MKKFIVLSILILFVACCTIKKYDGETELSFLIRQCTNDAKKTGNFDICRTLIEQQVKLSDDERLYKRYEYCKANRDDSQKFSECWLSLNQR